jgi:Icc-related predicted phosphoesterase
MKNEIKILLFSDTHGKHNLLDLPTDGIDMCIFAGDAGTYKNPYTNIGSILNFIDWYAKVPINNKIWIAGNHCTSIEAGLVDARKLSEENGLIYLEHETKIVNGIEIFGSPYTPYFYNWAYNVDRGKIKDYWNLIPKTTEILVTHGPTYGISNLGVVEQGEDVGDEELTKVIKNNLNNLKLTVFGHIHEGYGYHEEDDKLFVNASVLNLEYQLVNKPFIVTMDLDTKNIISIE